MSDRRAIIRIPHLLTQNTGVEFPNDNTKHMKVQGRGDTTTVNMGFHWDLPKTVQEVMEVHVQGVQLQQEGPPVGLPQCPLLQ